ncbi:MAG: hypothetical protein WAL50_13435 [Kineosporiaceae bacterium]
MSDVRSAWKDTGERFAALGGSLKAHYDEQHDADDEKTKRELGEAAKRFAGALQDAVEALGAAAKDPAVKDDVRKVGTSLAGALSATFAGVSEDLRRMAERAQGDGPETGKSTADTAQPDSAPSTASEPGTSTASGAQEEGEAPKVEPWGTP